MSRQNSTKVKSQGTFRCFGIFAFAAGAMFYVVVEELIPEASSGQHSNLSTIGFAIGFVLMMVLDVVMG
jgi:ZIP family zinc transporter